MAELNLNSPLQFVKGVGPKKAEVLAEFGYQTVGDILFYFPRKYLDRSSISTIETLQVGQVATIIGKVKAHGVLYGGSRRYEVIFEDETGSIFLLWFHSIRFWERLFQKGQIFAVTGKITAYKALQIIHPELERLEEDTDKLIHSGRIIPVYPQIKELNKVGLNSRGMRKVTNFIFENLKEKLPDYLEENYLESLKLTSLNHAVTNIHFPESIELTEMARRRLAFDEILNFLFMVFEGKKNRALEKKLHAYKASKIVKEFISRLKFKLTSGQEKSIKEIIVDLKKEQPMFRMLQGDVGSGKTVVAVCASLFVAANKLQTAFMVPTEILAEQHYRNWKETIESLGFSSALLTSSCKAKEKKDIAERCASGEIDILFGTHAMIYDYLSFKELGLIIIDEQHRFGVEQRSKLHAKGDNPDLLVMTATPIPRTLALTLYGDLDFSTIDTMPPGRQEIRSVWRMDDVKEKVYDFVKDEIKKGGQVYIIYPLIEKSDLIELENVTDSYEELSKSTFKDFNIAMLHGKTKSKEKDQILSDFRDKKIDILLSTTVIEVGIDNPNATVMIVEHAERFGLAQLHQLRGRIGRGEKKSTFIALAHAPVSEIAEKRLEYLSGTTDGFKISEADLELRGPGEIFGLKQSGIPEFRAVNLTKDKDLLEEAKLLLENIFSKSNSLDSKQEKIYKYLSETSKKKENALSGG